MYKKIRWAALCVAASTAFAQEWTEQRVLDLFEQQTPMRRESRAAAAAAVETVRGRTLWPNPVAGYSRETVGFTEFVTGEQQLPLSGRIRLEKQAMLPAQQTAEAQGEARIWETRALVRSAFYRALQAQEQGRAIKSALAEIESIIELLRVREREGEGSRYDRMRVERETADLRADLALANARAASERAVLLAYLPPKTELGALTGELRPRLTALLREDLLNRALESRRELRAESIAIAQFALAQQVAERQRIPEPTVFAGLKRTDLGTFHGNGAVIGISIALPTFNKGQAEVARLTAERQRVEARREGLVQQITAATSGAYDVFALKLAALQAFERETGDSGAALVTMARAGYQDGELGVLQLLDAYRLTRLTALRRLELQAAVKDSEIELSRNAGFEVTQ
jgi:cobalt-zinc-cadmium efflux system outer membrane protein